MPNGPDSPKSELPMLYRHKTSSAEETRPWPAKDLPGSTEETSEGVWRFEDKNAAAHLIRNAVGRGDREQWRQILSLKGSAQREMQDDQAVG